MIALIFADVWKTTFISILLLAGLQSILTFMKLHSIDGATWQSL